MKTSPKRTRVAKKYFIGGWHLALITGRRMSRSSSSLGVYSRQREVGVVCDEFESGIAAGSAVFLPVIAFSLECNDFDPKGCLCGAVAGKSDGDFH